MDDNPLVSVIVPVYNAERYLKESVNSILQQTYRRLEILICDDCSTDSSWEISKAFLDPRIRLFRNDRNQGYLRTVNFLVSNSLGPFLCFQDADDYSHPERIRIQLNALLSDARLGLVGSNYAMINPTGKILLNKDVESDSQELRNLLESVNPFQKPSIMFTREVYTTVGMYREGFLKLGNISEDFDWILRTSECFEVGNVNHEKPLYFYRSVSTAMSKKILSVNQLFGHEIARFLARQRRSGEKDSLDKEDFKALEEQILELRKPYIEDRSLFHHKIAASQMYAGLNASAIRQAFLAILKGPLSWNNYRLLQYCLRKTFLGF